jgi:hypothetical protein
MAAALRQYTPPHHHSCREPLAASGAEYGILASPSEVSRLSTVKKDSGNYGILVYFFGVF